MTDATITPSGRARPATAALGGLLLAAALLLLYAGQHLTFFYDEWTFILTRRGGGIGIYLDPHNGHLSLFPVIVYKLLFSIFGLRHYTPYRAVGIALHLLCAALLYVLVRRRVGPWFALVPTALLLFMGTSFQDLLWPFQISYLASIAGGLGALTLLERRDPPRDAGAAALLVWSVASSGVGIAFLLACAVLLIAPPADWRRLWIVAVPTLLFLAWYAGWGSGDSITSKAVLDAPGYVAGAGAGAVAGIAGLDDGTWGAPLAVALIAAISVAWRSRRGGDPTLMLLAVVCGILAFWALTAITRADNAEPAASRYLYVGAVFIMLIAAEASLGTGVRRAWLAFPGVLVLGALIANLGVLREGERGLHRIDASVRASLAAVEIASPVVSPAFLPEPVNAPQITAGPYLAAIRDLGSPALTLPELEHAPESTRVNSDQVLVRAERLVPVPAAGSIGGASRPVVEAHSGGRLEVLRLCDRLIPTAGAAALDVRVAPGGQLLVHAGGGTPAGIYLRRLAATFPAPMAFVRGGASAMVSFPVDLDRLLPWYVRVSGSQATEVCVR